MTPKLRKLKETWVVAIALLAAMLLASHQVSQDNEFGLAANYIYWFFRILIQASIFIAVLAAMERYLGQLLHKWALFALAILLSLIPYALTITAFDLIVGLPEIGFNSDLSSQISTAKAFGFELIYLLDNHVVLCLMLLLPQVLLSNVDLKQEAEPDKIRLDASENTDTPIAFFKSLEPALAGDLCSVEAQEHYVQVISTDESRLVLYRFSDVVRQLPSSLGMQVHRSHWVAYSAVRKVVMQGQTMKLALNDERLIPVSRTFRTAVEEQFEDN